MLRRTHRSTRTDTLFPYTTLFRSAQLRQITELRIVECPEDASDIPDNPNIGGVIAIARFSGSAQLQGKVSRRTSQGLGDRTDVHVRQHERFPVRSAARLEGKECVRTS